MPRLVVLDALGLVYRAHYAFIGRPLTRTLARADGPGTVRHVGVVMQEDRGVRLVAGEGGLLERVAPDGTVLQRSDVPFGSEVRVTDGAEVTAGQELVRHNVSAMYGFANTVLKLRREQAPDYWALAWDGPGPTFRHEKFPAYKVDRKPMPLDLTAQLAPIEELAGALGLPVIEEPRMEADDVMATLARCGVEAGHDVVLVTGDKDMLQVVDERVTVLCPIGKGEDYQPMDSDAVRARWGVGPEHIRDVLALMGDATDGIPGVPGVGEKTAVELMSRFESVDRLYERITEVTKPALRRRLEEHREQVYLSRELATVRADLDLACAIESLRVAPIRRDDLTAFARRWELRRLETIAAAEGVEPGAAGPRVAARPAERRGTAAEQPVPVPAGHRPADAVAGVPADSPAPPDEGANGDLFGVPSRAAVAVAVPGVLRGEPQGSLDLWSSATVEEGVAAGPSADAIVERLHAVRARALHGLAVLPIAESGPPLRARLVGLAVAARDGTACYLPLAHAIGPNLPLEQVREWLGPAFSDESVPKVGHDLKRDRHLLASAGLALCGTSFDVHVGSFLCDPARDHSLAALAADVLAVTLAPFDGAAPRGRTRPGASAVPVGAAIELGVRAAAALHPLAEALTAQLEARDQMKLYRDLEHPLIEVLWEMERAGIALDRPVLAGMSGEAAAELARLEGELYGLAGGPLNLNSGRELAQVLFERLGLKPLRRTKTGVSTDQAVLEALAVEHPFPRLLLEWRALAKLRSTYLDALPLTADPVDARVHTTYEQTGAATGRLSSSDPNLQNIPMRTAQGRAIRRAFVAAPGYVLVGADYSQIELRVMAHLSGDPALIEAFDSGEDVHAATARRIFKVAGEVDPALRSRAKIVNFGVMYGMGARSLGQQMGIPLDEARAFIDGYFSAYAGVRAFLDRTLIEARERGWVQTLLGRRRYLPQLRAGNGLERSNAERAAINTPIQGSAADLVKLAMLCVRGALKAHAPSARLLLQVHDELLIECPASDAAAVSERTRSAMESCFPLRVPLTVSVGRGRTWFDVH